MSMADDIYGRLVDAGVVSAVNVFIGAGAKFPPATQHGTYLGLVVTGGTGPQRIHNERGTGTRRPGVQIKVRSPSYALSDAMAQAAYSVLTKISNEIINGTLYKQFQPLQEPFDDGVDGSNRVVVAFNLLVTKGS